MPIVREVSATAYQRDRDFVIDATETEAAFGLTATPWDQALAATLTGMGVVPAAAPVKG
jgi:hypothetical protein